MALMVGRVKASAGLYPALHLRLVGLCEMVGVLLGCANGADQLSDDWSFFLLSNEFLESLFSCVISKMCLIANFPRNPSLFPV